MENTEYFILALKHYLNTKNITQNVLGNHINADQRHISEFINKKRNFSDSKKSIIAEFFNTTHLDMLILGRELAQENTPDEDEKRTRCVFENPAPSSGSPADTKARMIEKINQMLGVMDEKELRELERINENILEKKQMREKLEKLEKEIQLKKAG